MLRHGRQSARCGRDGARPSKHEESPSRRPCYNSASLLPSASSSCFFLPWTGAAPMLPRPPRPSLPSSFPRPSRSSRLSRASSNCGGGPASPLPKGGMRGNLKVTRGSSLEIAPCARLILPQFSGGRSAEFSPDPSLARRGTGHPSYSPPSMNGYLGMGLGIGICVEKLQRGPGVEPQGFLAMILQ